MFGKKELVVLLVMISVGLSLDWTKLHHDTNNTGFTSSLGADKSVPPLSLWNFSLEGATQQTYSSPIIYQGRIFVPSQYNVYSVNSTTGTMLWNWTIVGVGGVFSTPAYYDDKIFVGSYYQVGNAPPGKLWGLNSTTGVMIWNYSALNTFYGSYTGSPSAFDGRVYWGTRDKHLYSINTTDGTQIWNFTTGGAVQGTPTIVNGAVFISSEDGKLYAINSTTGVNIWNVTINVGGTNSYISAMFHDGTLYMGTGANGDLTRFIAINSTTGALRWIYIAGNYIYSTPAYYEGVVVFGSNDFVIQGLNATTGLQIWQTVTGSNIFSSPAISGDGTVYISSFDNKTYALNYKTGSTYWTFDHHKRVSWNSPALADNVTYVVSDNYLWALGNSTPIVANYTITYTNPEYETNNTLITIDFKNSSYNVTLTYNSSTSNQTMLNTTPTHFYQNILEPLINTNNTIVLFNFTYNQLDSLSNPQYYQSVTYNQSLIYAYWIDTVNVSKNPAFVGDTVVITTNAEKRINNVNISVNISFNGVNYSGLYVGQVGNNVTYTTTITMPTMTDLNNKTYNITANLYATNGGNTQVRNATTNITVFNVLIDNCSSFSNQSISYSVWNESTVSNQLTSIDYDWSIIAWASDPTLAKTFSWTFRGVPNATICIYPNTASYFVNSTLTYRTTDGTLQRTMFWDIWNLNATLQKKRVYLESASALLQLTTIIVTDNFGNVMPAVITDIFRYDYNATQWFEIASTKSASNGQSAITLDINTVWYKFILYQNGVVLKEYAPMQIIVSTPGGIPLVTLSTGTNAPLGYNIYNSILANTHCSLSINNVLNCFMQDPTSSVTSSHFKVDENKLFGSITTCDQTANGSTASFVCDLSGATNSTTGYKYYLTVRLTLSPLRDYLVANGIVPGVTTGSPLGVLSVFLGMMIVLTCGLIGTWNPFVGMFITFFALIFTVMSGLLTIEISGLVGLLTVIFFITIKLKT